VRDSKEDETGSWLGQLNVLCRLALKRLQWSFGRSRENGEAAVASEERKVMCGVPGLPPPPLDKGVRMRVGGRRSTLDAPGTPKDSHREG
jgi:hypothetical protein